MLKQAANKEVFVFRVVSQMPLQVKTGREASQVLEVMMKSVEMNAERHVVSVLSVQNEVQ
jgi:hypothetical protein